MKGSQKTFEVPRDGRTNKPFKILDLTFFFFPLKYFFYLFFFYTLLSFVKRVLLGTLSLKEKRVESLRVPHPVPQMSLISNMTRTHFLLNFNKRNIVNQIEQANVCREELPS